MLNSFRYATTFSAYLGTRVTLLIAVTMLFVLFGTGEQVSADSENTLVGVCRLTWAPPAMENPETVWIEPSGGGTLRLDHNRDYILQMPDVPVTNSLYVIGGRNIIMIGGHISIPWQGDGASIRARTMLIFRETTGTVHVEGLLGDGEDISEGIQIDSPDAIVQIQNVRIENIHARDQNGFSDNHPDLVQVYGNAAQVRIDRLTGSSDYQGLMFQVDFNGPQKPIFVLRTNMRTLPTARYMFWVRPDGNAAPIVLRDVWLEVPPQRRDGLGGAVWPDVRGNFPNQAQISVDENGNNYATWPAEMRPQIDGRVTQGIPPGGDFVPRESVGIGYVSPGYIDLLVPGALNEERFRAC